MAPAESHEAPSTPAASAVPTVTWTPGPGQAGLGQMLASLGAEAGVPLPEGRLGSSLGLPSDDQRYAIGGLISEGGMGRVYEAREACTRRVVALKVIRSEQAGSRDRLLRFIAEAQVTAQLEHPNIVPVHELSVDTAGRYFYTMKRICGRTLDEVLNGLRKGDPTMRDNYPRVRLLNVFLRICDAVAFAHSRGVIHRDLKPANIMVGEYGEVLVMDWGLAKVLALTPEGDQPLAEAPEAPEMGVDTIRDSGGGHDGPTLAGSFLGTPCYMAPELARGEAGQASTLSDVYALGVILYELLTLHLPVPKAASVGETLANVAQGRIAPLRSVAPDVPPPLAAVAHRALALAAPDRYPSVVALQQDVQAWLDGFATQAEGAGFLRQLWLLAKRHRGVALLTAVSLILIAIVTGSFTWRLQHEQQALQRVSRLASPEFVAKATDAITERHLDQAEQWLSVATGLDAGNASAYLELGRLRLMRGQFGQAIDDLAQASELSVNATRAKALQSLASQLAQRHGRAPRELTEDESAAIAADLQRMGEADLAAWFFDQGKQARQALLARCESALQRLLVDNPGFEYDELPYRLHEDAGLIWTFPRSPALVTLVALRGLPINRLYIANSAVADLGPLEGMPLEHLVASGTPVTDLAPLHGTRLAYLELHSTPIDDLSPLAGMPLQHLILGGTAVADLTPLRGMPLETLNISRTKVADLSPLRGMPLQRLYADATPITSLDGLSGSPLHYLNIAYTMIDDVCPIADTKLEQLNMIGSKVHDIACLATLPLRTVSMSSTPVSDLTPLKGKLLNVLDVRWTKVSDLTPLKGMPLRQLYCEGTTVTDWQPVTTLTELEDLSVPIEAPGIEVLRSLENLKHLTDKIGPGKLTTVAEFWQAYDALHPDRTPPPLPPKPD